jgi:hypothetical protein
MGKRCKTCLLSEPRPFVAGSAKDGPQPPGGVFARRACGHYGIIVSEDDGQQCEYWLSSDESPQPKTEDGTDGSLSVLLGTKPNQERDECVAKLKPLFEAAQKGLLHSVLIIGFRDEDTVTMHWTPMTDRNGLRFVGALHSMAHLLTSRMDMRDMDGQEQGADAHSEDRVSVSEKAPAS